jgi:CP family cyanate transporter-like MFS transporter
VLPLAALVWLPQLGRHADAAPAAVAPGRPVWRSALAWQVTLFMGLNSFIYYVMIGWLPSVLASSGHSAARQARCTG